MAPMFQLPQTVVCCNHTNDEMNKDGEQHDLLDDIAALQHRTKGSNKSKIRSAMLAELSADESKEIESEEYTPLFKAIEESNWDKVMTLMLTGKTNEFSFFGLGASSQKDEPDLSVQARSWVFGKDWWGTVSFKKLPIHAAVINRAPLDVVKKLYSFYPEGARCKDLDGNLPLHLSFKHKADDDVTAFFLKVFPEAVSAKNKESQSPVDYASDGAGDIINLCIEQTKINAKKEEAKLNAALEAEKSRLTEILMQLADVRDELHSLRKNKKKQAAENAIAEKAAAAEAAEQEEHDDDPAIPVVEEEHSHENYGRKKKNSGKNKKKKLPWNKKHSVADEPKSPRQKASSHSRKK